VCRKGGKECVKSDNVTVAFSDLQDMQNHMRETIDQGMEELQSKQDKGEIPSAPPSAQAAPVPAAFAAAAPPPDTYAAKINQQTQAADQAEQEIAGAAALPVPAVPAPIVPLPSAPLTIALGQTVDEVTAGLGSPARDIDLGARKYTCTGT